MKEHQNNRQTPRILPCRDRPSPVLKFLDPPLGYDHKIFKHTINYIYTDRLKYEHVFDQQLMNLIDRHMHL